MLFRSGSSLVTGATLAQVAGLAQAKTRPSEKKPELFTPKPTKPDVKESVPQGDMVTIAGDLKGYYVKPNQGRGPFPAVVVIMEAFGLNDQIKSVCNLYAKYGYAAIAPDIYYGESYPYDKINDAVAKLKTLKDETVVKEFGQTLDYLGKQFNVRKNAIGTVGFCMGGRYAFLMSAADALIRSPWAALMRNAYRPPIQNPTVPIAFLRTLNCLPK